MDGAIILNVKIGKAMVDIYISIIESCQFLVTDCMAQW